MRIHIYVEKEDLENLKRSIEDRDESIIPVYFEERDLNLEDGLEVSITPDEYSWLENNR